MLKEACSKRSVAFEVISSEDYNFSSPVTLSKGTILYKVSTDLRSSAVFKSLLRDDIATVYHDNDVAIAYTENSSMLHQKHGLPIIKTIFDITRNRELLQAYATYLGGFPLIIKVLGGSHGVGVMKIDSLESLVSVADFLIGSKGDAKYMLRQYIDHEYSARLTVVGNKVADSIEYKRVSGDFRSNVGSELTVSVKKFDASIEALAIRAVAVLQSDFGGVDILIDKHGNGFLAEVNIPCFFPRSQMISGVDIAGQLVELLSKKSAKLL